MMGLLCKRAFSNGVLLWAVVWLKLLVFSQTVNAALEIRCFPVDRGSPKFLTSAGSFNPVSVTHEDCIKACGLLVDDINQAGLKSGQCLCTNISYTLTDPVSNNCGQPCGGDTNQACGNSTHIAVLSTPGSWVDVHITEPAQPVISGQDISLAVTETLGDDVLIAFDVGDGSLPTEFSSSGMTDHVYLTSGEFVVVVTTQTNAVINGFSALPINVAMEITDVCLRCPVAVEILVPFECSVEVSQGSDVSLTLTVGDEVQPTQTLGSPQFTMLGVIGQNGSDVQDPVSTWLLPGTESLQQSARLLAVEGLITLVGDGSFTLMILKPVCTGVGGEYCATDNICTSVPCDTCSSTSQFYCLAEKVCTTPSEAQSRLNPRPDRFSEDPQRPSYEIVKSVPMTVASLGVFRYIFTDPVCDLFPVGIGYILGFSVTAGGARIGTEVEESGMTNVSNIEYKSTSLASLNVGTTLQLSSFELNATRHLLRAVVVSPLISRSQFSIQDGGEYEISASVNPSGVMNSTNVSAIIPIKGLSHTDVKNSSIPNSEITATIWVQNGSHIHYYIDWGDGTQNVVYLLDTTPFNETHNYTVVGIYELNITASNLFSNETALNTIIIQNPIIKSHYDITTNSPQAVDGKGTRGPVVVTIQLTNPSREPVATSSEATFTCIEGEPCPSADFADLSSLTVDRESETHMLYFTEQGVYTINITIANLVSEESYIVKIEIFETLTEVIARTYYKPSSSASSVRRPGYGNLNNTFPLDRPVIFKMSYSTGSSVNYIVDFGDGLELGKYTHELKGEPFTFEHQFPRTGKFDVVLTSSNPVTPPKDLSFKVTILRPIRGIHILDTKVTRINETRNLTLTMEDIGTESCLIVNFNDNTPSVAYGECATHNGTILGNLSFEILLSHKYTEQGNFDVLAYGWNTLSSESASILIPVMEAKKHCGLPTTSIQSPSPGWWLPKVRTRKDRLSFLGVTKLDCWFTDNTKLWTLHKVDPQTGIIGENVTSKLEQHGDTVTLVIKEFDLDVDLYRIGFKVTMNKTLTENIEISAVAYDYFDIQRSMLIVALIDSELTSFVKAWGTSLDLIPGIVSRDPDLPPGEEQAFDNITYLCRRKGEQWPSTKVPIAIPLERNESTNINNTGCFGTGPGILDHFDDTLSWNTSLLDLNVVFEIMVLIIKDVRRGNFSLFVEVEVGDPPQAAIKIGDGTIFAPGDGVQIINPTSSVRLSASCREFCDGIVYTWEMHGINSAGIDVKVPGWETLTSGNKEHLYVEKELFQLEPRFSVYQFTANLRNIQGGQGYAGLKIRLNQPPAGGSCNVPSHNLTLGVAVRVTCEGWKDYEGIVSYKFFAQAKNLQGQVILLTSAQTVVELSPPLGPEIDDYKVSLGVTVEDLIGASTTVIFANVTVTPPTAKRSENFTAEQEALYETLKAEGNPEVINSQLILDASLLFAAPVTTPSQDAVDNSTDSSVKSEEELQKAAEEKAAAIAAKTEEVTRMAELVSSVEYTSSEDVISTASTLSLITQDPTVLSPKTLDLMTGAADSMLSIIEDDATAPADENKVNQVGAGIVSIVGNLFAGTEQSVIGTPAGSNSNPTSSPGQDASPEEEEETTKAREQTTKTLSKLEGIMEGIFSLVVGDKIPGEPPTIFSSPNLELRVDRNTAGAIANKTMSDSVGNVKLTDWCHLTGQEFNCSTEETVDMKLQSTPTNAYSIYPGGNAESFNDGGLVNLTFFGNGSQEIQIHNLSDDSLIDINFKQVDASLDEGFTFVDVSGGNYTLNHKFILEGPAETVFIQFRPENQSAVYALLVSSETSPTLTEYDFFYLLPNVSETEFTSSPAPEYVDNVDNDPIHTSTSSSFSNSTENSTSGAISNSTKNSTDGWTTVSYSTLDSTTEPTDMSTSSATTFSPQGQKTKKTKPKHPHWTSTEGVNTSAWSTTPDVSTTDNPLTSNQSTSLAVTSDPDGTDSADALTTSTWSTTPESSTRVNPTTSNWSTSSPVTSDPLSGNSNSAGVDTDTDSSDQSDEVVTHTVSFGKDSHNGKTGSYIFRLAEVAPDGALEENFTMNYSLRVIQAQCAYFDIKNNTWYTDGVKMVMNNKTNLPVCQTSHLTPFASSWVVKPAPLNFETLFSDASILANPTIYATCAVVYTFFFLVFVWARRKDKKDILQLGVTPLPDNNPSHSYLYEMVVITGKRMNAGTNSKVSFVLSGEDDETDTMSLEDTKRQTLQRGCIDRFLLATARPLGTLNYMRVWHDNSGKGNAQSWYLSYIAVRDLQTKQRYFFICNEWFSVVEGDGQVDRLLPVAGKEQVQEFGHVFSSQTGKNFNDSHMWVSILTRPPGSRFTRMQRAMCCMLAMWLEMLTSIMFYQVADEGPSTKPINLGAFSLSPKEIAVGVQSNLMIFPVTLLMVQLFRKSRVRKKRRSRIEVAREEQVKMIGKNSVHPIKTKEDHANCDSVSSRDIFIINNENDTSRVDIEDTKPLCKSKPKRRQRLSFPWWFVYVAWTLSIIVTLLATLFTFFYGLEYKNHKVTSWLHSIIISFFCGVILTQPIKVVLVSLFIALVFKSPNSDEDTDLEDDEEDCELKQDEEWLHNIFGTSNVHPAAKQRPDPQATEKIRNRRIKELKMYSIIREIMFLIIFIWILSVFSYGNHDPYSFWTKDSYVKLLVNGDRNHTLMKAISIPKFWQWVETGLIPGLIAGRWYNNKAPGIDQQYFLGDRYSKILGKVYFRQLRVPRGECEIRSKMKGIISECNIGYSMGQEDKAPYGVGWTAYNPNVTQRPEYNYTDATKLDSYPIWGRHALYLGGGYIFDVDVSSIEGVKASMKRMYEEAWIDRYTRVLFIEISVYNAQTNLFSYINLMQEILPTGGCYPWYRMDILRLLQYNEGMGLVRLICEVSYFVFIVFMLVKEILLARKEGKKYLKDIWNLNEMFIIGLSITLMVIYFYRLYITSAFLENYQKAKKNDYVNLQYVAYWNLLLGYMLGLVVFLSNFKFLKLLRFNRRMGILSSTIQSCSKELMHFLFMFFFVFTAFAAVFYLIFCNQLYNYSDILFTMETMITAVLGKFKFGEMLSVSILGPFFFFCFTGYVCFVMINVFLTIIIGAFHTVKGDIDKQSNDYEMVDFILNRFTSWTGIGGKKVEEDLPNLDMEEYKTDVTNSLPDKVDQMLNRIARVYFDEGTFNTFVKEMSDQEKKVEKKQKKRCNRKIFTA
ncbi:uncharacterized protein [Asterias amurensis]|uniref:uncharacterized protein n=1 Tax=Asterias amurensis TaxID=7602 RepID=UPI003AB76926